MCKVEFFLDNINGLYHQAFVSVRIQTEKQKPSQKSAERIWYKDWVKHKDRNYKEQPSPKTKNPKRRGWCCQRGPAELGLRLLRKRALPNRSWHLGQCAVSSRSIERCWSGDQLQLPEQKAIGQMTLMKTASKRKELVSSRIFLPFSISFQRPVLVDQGEK